MRLPRPFVKLPIQFDPDRLMAEVDSFSESDWRPHPLGYPGNSALILVSSNGGNNDDFDGIMQPTANLKRCPYICQALASLETVIGRSRLMRLAPGAEVKTHSDTNIYWHDRVRIHIPIVTDPGVMFICGDNEVHMAPGETWVFDNWRPHKVINPSGITRVHLVADTVGSAAFWHMVALGASPESPPPRLIDDTVIENFEVPTEQYPGLAVADPARVRNIVQEIIGELHALPHRTSNDQSIERLLVSLVQDWQALWVLYGPEPAGWQHYSSVINQSMRELSKYAAGIRVPSNGIELTVMLESFIPAFLNFPKAPAATLDVPVPRFEKPVIVLAAPRSGSTLIFEALSRHPDLWTVGDESHLHIESVPGLSPQERGFSSNALSMNDLTPDRKAQLLRNFSQDLVDHTGRKYQELDESMRPKNVRFLEKTPKNSLRAPFFNALFPDALFLFLYRDPASNISSMIDAWNSGRFITYPDLPGWDGPPWSLLLTEGWREYNGKPIAEIATHQWIEANQTILNELETLPSKRWKILSYQSLIDDPARCLSAIHAFAGLNTIEPRETTVMKLPLSRYTLTPPSPDKWKKNAGQLEPLLPRTAALFEQLAAAENQLL